MTIRFLRLGLLMLANCWAVPAAAIDVSAEAGIVSDYRYRGLSLSNGKPAAQASATFEHASGAYVSIWSSTIKEPDFDADVEIDLTGGYSFDLVDNLRLDLSATYYAYPSESGSNYAEATAILERKAGPLTLSTGFSFGPKQRGTRDEHGDASHNSYLFTAASYELSGFPLALDAQLGYERGAFDEAETGGKWDWGLGGSVELGKFRVGLAYSGADTGNDVLVASLFLVL